MKDIILKQKSMEMAMAMAMGICRKESEDEQTIKKSKRKIDRFVILPDDILLDILKRLPESSLRYKAKYVCRKWWNLISWVLLDHASFILQKTSNLTARYVGIREEGHGLQVKIQDLDIPRIGIIRSWGNEFLLISDYREIKQSLYVYNLITKEGSNLPECIASCGGDCSSIKCGVALSFNRFEEIYKVVHLFMGPPIECHILILRSDIVSSKWKKIQVPCMNGGSLCFSSPVSVQGRYFHWDNYIYKRLVSIDMTKEEIVDMSLPRDDHIGFDYYIIFEMGGSLALFAGDTPDKTVIWILKDFQKKKWEKLHSVTLEKWSYRRYPFCGVMSKRYIILECKYDMGMCYYDLKNGVVKKLDIHINDDDGCLIHSSP